MGKILGTAEEALGCTLSLHPRFTLVSEATSSSSAKIWTSLILWEAMRPVRSYASLESVTSTIEISFLDIPRAAGSTTVRVSGIIHCSTDLQTSECVTSANDHPFSQKRREFPLSLPFTPFTTACASPTPLMNQIMQHRRHILRLLFYFCSTFECNLSASTTDYRILLHI